MNTPYYSEKKIKKEQARMNQRACRPFLHGYPFEVPTRNGGMKALLYNKENLHPGYLIVEVHGGGFMYNHAEDDDNFCHYIHKMLGIPVIACDYSLTPQAKFPVGLEDVYDCIKYALTSKKLQAQPDKIILWGHSAGANLAAGVSYLSTFNKGVDFTPCMQILDYPYMDPYRYADERKKIPASVSGKLMDTFAHYYTEEEEDLAHILISPILYPAKEFVGMPKTFILLCGRDNLNEGGRRYGYVLQRAGVPVTYHYVPEALHGFVENHFNYPYLTPIERVPITKNQRRLAEKTINSICQWIKKETTD